MRPAASPTRAAPGVSFVTRSKRAEEEAGGSRKRRKGGKGREEEAIRERPQALLDYVGIGRFSPNISRS